MIENYKKEIERLKQELKEMTELKDHFNEMAFLQVQRVREISCIKDELIEVKLNFVDNQQTYSLLDKFLCSIHDHERSADKVVRALDYKISSLKTNFLNVSLGKSFEDIIQECMKNKESDLKRILEKYNLTTEDIGVFLYDEETREIQRFSYNPVNEPIVIWYSVTNKKLHHIMMNENHEKIKG